MEKVIIINGPNMNMLGKRKASVYGAKTLEEMNTIIMKKAQEVDISVEFFQSDFEGEIIQKIHNSHTEFDGIIINAAALSHYSIAIRDAIECSGIPCIEVHMSNIYARENFRHHSVISSVCVGSICGFGINSYIAALNIIVDL